MSAYLMGIISGCCNDRWWCLLIDKINQNKNTLMVQDYHCCDRMVPRTDNDVEMAITSHLIPI